MGSEMKINRCELRYGAQSGVEYICGDQEMGRVSDCDFRPGWDKWICSYSLRTENPSGKPFGVICYCKSEGAISDVTKKAKVEIGWHED